MFYQWLEVGWLFFYGDSCIWHRSYAKLFQVSFQIPWNCFHLNYFLLNLGKFTVIATGTVIATCNTLSLIGVALLLKLFFKGDFFQSKEWNLTS